MTKRIFYLLSVLLVTAVAFGQSKQAAVAKPTSSELKKIMTGVSLPYKMVNDSLAVIPFEGANIASYNVLIQKISDLYIVFTNLSEALPTKIDEKKYKHLLQLNDQFDIVKIGIGEDNTAYVRADVYKSTMNAGVLTRIIKQVANVTNIVAGDLK